MNNIPTILFLTLLVAWLEAPPARARGESASGSHQVLAQLPEIPRQERRREADAFVVGEIAEERRQVPVEEAVDLPDSPAVNAAQGDAEAQLPAGGGGPSGVQQPEAESAPALNQPAMEP